MTADTDAAARPLRPADEWDQAAGLTVLAGAEPAADDEAELLYPDLEAWVTEHFSQLLRRPEHQLAWCPEWWRHPEAVSRLEAMWRAWEALRADPAFGMSTWWIHHADPHLSVLLDKSYGPFTECSLRKGHNDQPGLPVEAAPEGYWGEDAL